MKSRLVAALPSRIGSCKVAAIVSIIVLASCSGANPDTSTVTALPSIAATKLSLQSSPTASPSPILAPSESGPEPTLALVAPVPTFQPACNPETESTSLQGLLRSNGGCDLPCLWTLCPGLTDGGALRAFYDRLAGLAHPEDTVVKLLHPEAPDGGWASIDISQGSTRLSVNLVPSMSAGKLEYIRAGISAAKEERQGDEIVRAEAAYGNPLFRDEFYPFLLPQVLSRFGSPSEVLVLPILYDPPSLRDSIFSMVMLYRDHHFFVEYVLPNDAAGFDYRGCPSQTGHITLIAWSNQQDPTLADLARLNSGRGMNELNVDYYMPIDKAASLTVDGFHNLFANPDESACVRTARSLWPY